MRIWTVAAIVLVTSVCMGATENRGLQSPLKPPSASRHAYPKITLYSVSWCPHCQAAKEYFAQHNIPYINKDVELDDDAMAELTKKYKSQGVPVLVIGKDEVILKGFDQQKFEKAIKDVQKR